MYLKRKDRLHERLEIDIEPFKVNGFTSFHTLNISASGALIGSYTLLELKTNELMHVCLDPWCEYFAKPIVCVARVARVAAPQSKGMLKYLKLRGEDPDIATLVGIEFLMIPISDRRILEEFTINAFTMTA